MSDAATEAFHDTYEGLLPPKGWGWKSVTQQRKLLLKYLENPDKIKPWMLIQARQLGIRIEKHD